MVMATPGLLTEPWNPVAGSNWINDQMMIRATDDPALLPDPFTGLYWPQRISRAEVTVQEGVPVERTLDWLTLDTAEEIDEAATRTEADSIAEAAVDAQTRAHSADEAEEAEEAQDAKRPEDTDDPGEQGDRP